jgi:hypothetical protein
MTNRRIQLVALVAISIFLVILPKVSLRPVPCAVHLQRETCEKLDKGMTRQQIEAILGGPPGDYTTRPDIGYGQFTLGMVSNEIQQGNVTEFAWRTDDYEITVRFDGNGRAIAIAGASGHISRPGMSYPSLLLWRARRFVLGP